MAKRPREGRPSVFRGKDKHRGPVQGILTPTGRRRFEEARGRLARLAARPVKQISDGDTVEYLARGHDDTLDYLEKQLGG